MATTKAKAAIAGVGGVTRTVMTTNSPQLASSDASLVLGTIVTSLEVLTREDLLAVTRQIQARGLHDFPQRLNQCNTSVLRSLVDGLAREFHKSKRGKCLDELNDILSAVQVQSLEKSRG